MIRVNNKAALYARFSSDNQRSESIDAQVRAMTAYCKQHNFEIVDTYIDEAKSATTDRRPAFQQMIADSSNGTFNILLVHKLDRFARNRYDSAVYKRELKKNGVLVYSVLENLDNSPESIMMEAVLEGMSEYYSQNLAREVMKGMRETALQCKHTGGKPPLGYDVDPVTRQLIVNPTEADSVKIIFSMYADGYGYSPILERLNSEGRKTKNGNEFMKNSLYSILTNPKYQGMYVFNRSSAHSAEGTRNTHLYKNNEDIIFIDNGCPRIVEPAVYEKVQRRITENKRIGAQHNAKHNYLLTGKVYCKECGLTMVGNARHSGRDKSLYVTYRCPSKHYSCSNKEINREKRSESMSATWRVRNHAIEVYNDDSDTYGKYCDEVKVSKIITDLFSRDKKYELYIYDSVTGEVTEEIDAQQLTLKILPFLLRKGLRLYDTEEDTLVILQILWDTVESAPHQYRHDRLGFYDLNNELVYLARNVIGSSDPLITDSEYIYNEKTTPKGTLNSWLDFVNAEVIGKPNLELALALGAASPTTCLLRRSHLLQICPIISLIGASSSGKTTSLRLMSSIYGSPDETYGNIGDLNCTQNAFFESLVNSNGYLCPFDETSAVPEWKFNKVFYNLPKGHIPLRCNGDGSLKEIKRFSSTVIFTGETSLFEQTTKTDGTRARLLEFRLQWTDSAEHSDRIIKGSFENHGTALKPMIEWMLSHLDQINVHFLEEIEVLRQKTILGNGVEDRVFKIYATILTSAYVIRESLGLNLDIPVMRELLLEQYRLTLPELDYYEEKYNLLLSEILAHKSHFPAETKRSMKHEHTRDIWRSSSTYGSMDYCKGFT